MSRRRPAVKRQVLPDPKYKSEDLAKFINTVMEDGKKSIAEKIVYGALDGVKVKLLSNPQGADEGGDEGGSVIALFKTILANIAPNVEVKSRRVGGSQYQVPVEIRDERRMALAMRWLVIYARKRSERSMVERLQGEMLDAYANKGNAVKKREDTHRMADANKAFAHFRW
jgi:small subunit ribosomal protein S7